MKTIKNLAFAALAALTVTLLLPTSPAVAGNCAPVRLTFFKAYAGDGPAPYVFHFAGTFGGDFSGTLFTGVLNIVFNKKTTHLEAVYVFTANDGIHSFTVQVEGNENNQTKKAVLNGRVIDGYLEGARVQVRFDDNGDGSYNGVVRIMTGSAD